MPFNPRTFLEEAGSALTGTTREELLQACAAYATCTTPRQKAASIHGMMQLLDRELDGRTRARIMQTCGRRCIGAATLQKARRLQRDARDLDDLLSRLNTAHIGGGRLWREGDIIHAGYDRCYCGSVKAAREPFSPTYCHCSCGWYRQLFETLLDRPVHVELANSILQGAERCDFRIHLRTSD